MTTQPLHPPHRAVALQVDGEIVRATEGESLLDVCRAAGIDVPTLCYGENLAPRSACRVCVVELEGNRTLVPACSRAAEDGQTVHTDSPRVRHSRKLVLELLGSSVDLSNAPGVAEWIARYGADPSRFGSPAPAGDDDGTSGPDESHPQQPGIAPAGEHERPEPGDVATVAAPPKVDNPLYVRDYARCILCFKCVDACGDQRQATFAISAAGRGFDTRIAAQFDAALPDSACVYCGNCITVCPTGALLPTAEFDLREAGRWNPELQHETTTVCPYCGVGCNLTLHVQDNEIFKVSSPSDHSVGHGNLCVKGRFGYTHVQPPTLRRREG